MFYRGGEKKKEEKKLLASPPTRLVTGMSSSTVLCLLLILTHVSFCPYHISCVPSFFFLVRTDIALLSFSFPRLTTAYHCPINLVLDFYETNARKKAPAHIPGDKLRAQEPCNLLLLLIPLVFFCLPFLVVTCSSLFSFVHLCLQFCCMCIWLTRAILSFFWPCFTVQWIYFTKYPLNQFPLFNVKPTRWQSMQELLSMWKRRQARHNEQGQGPSTFTWWYALVTYCWFDFFFNPTKERSYVDPQCLWNSATLHYEQPSNE